MLRFLMKFALAGTMLMASITPPVITHAFARGGGNLWFAGEGFDIVGALLGLAPQPGWHVRSQASHERNFRRSHKAQRINASLKPREAPPRKTLLDQEPNPGPRANEIPTAGAPAADRAAAADRAPDEVQTAPAYVVEREAGPTVGMAPVIGPADAAQNTPPPPVIESKGTWITRSLGALSVVMLVIVALGLIKFRLRRTYAKRGFAAGAMRRLPGPADYVSRVELLRRQENQVEADYEAALRVAKKALDKIAEAEAEMVSSRPLRTPSLDWSEPRLLTARRTGD